MKTEVIFLFLVFLLLFGIFVYERDYSNKVKEDIKQKLNLSSQKDKTPIFDLISTFKFLIVSICIIGLLYLVFYLNKKHI